MDGEMMRIEQRAWNWGRWAAGGGGGCCGEIASAERLYVAPRPEDALVVRRTPTAVDQADAEHIERCVVALPSAADRKFMKRRFVRGLSEPELVQQMRLEHTDMLRAHTVRVLTELNQVAQLTPEQIGRIIQQRVARLKLVPTWRLDRPWRVRI